MTSASAAPTTSPGPTPDEEQALRLLARFLVRAYLADRKPAPNPLDLPTESAPSLEPMTGDDEP